MILLVSGEGISDIGATASSEVPASSANVKWGAMGRIIDRIMENEWGFSPIDTGAMLFLSESELGRLTKEIRGGLALPDRERGQETAYFFKNARAIARLARKVQQSEGSTVGAVLFRDADRTNSHDRSQRADKVNSMRNGFLAESFEYGVPMVPQPKSETWLICALQPQPYQNCKRFETISGNDSSPNSAKKQLIAALQGRPNKAADLADLVIEGAVDVQRIDMPSFNEFLERMKEVAKAMLSAPKEPN
jgi:hypothetical protein